MPRLPPAALVAALALVPAAQAARAAAAATPRDWEPDVAAARAYALARTGTIAFSVRTERGQDGLRADHPFQSASVVKAMFLVAYLRRPAVRRRPLRPADRKLLTPMIRWSSNEHASQVRNLLGYGALERFARRAGMKRFAEDPWWGRSLITARDQTRFFLQLDRLLPPRHRRYAMGLLHRIVPEQRWGVGRVRPHGWRLYFKGGWGAGRGAVNHQVALLVHGDQRVAVAVLTHGSPGHAYATATLEGVFRRLLRGLAGHH